MFSKLRKIGSTFTSQTRYWFSQKRSLKQKMRSNNYTSEKIDKQKQQGHLHIGLYGLVFACCFAAIPLYRTFCEHVGLVGNNDKKTYQFKNAKISNLKKYKVKFEGMPQSDINWQFQPVEKQVIVSASQTAIIFYRLRNRQNRPIVGFSTYNISPQQANIYFSKIQCFCFNQQMINPQQQLLLPLFFYLEPELNEDPDIGRIKEITVNYQFYESNNQDLAKFAAQQIRRVQENKRKLQALRAKKSNMSIQEYKQAQQQKLQKQTDEPLLIDVQAIKASVDAKIAASKS